MLVLNEIHVEFERKKIASITQKGKGEQRTWRQGALQHLSDVHVALSGSRTQNHREIEKARTAKGGGKRKMRIAC